MTDSYAPLSYLDGAGNRIYVGDPRYTGASSDGLAVVVDTDYTGATDASADINAAIATAFDIGQAFTPNVWSMPVYLKPGLLRLDAPIVARRRTRLIGAGIRNTILKPYGNVTAITAGSTYGRDDMMFSGFQIDGANQTGSVGFSEPKGMYFTYGLRVHISNLWVQNTWASGIGIDFVTGTIRDCHVNNCGRQNAAFASGTWLGCSGIGIGAGESSAEEPLSIVNNICKANSNYGIFVETQMQVEKVGYNITGNYCEGNRLAGIGDSGASGARIAHNTCAHNVGAGIAIDYGSMTAAGNGRPGTHSMIDGNHLYDNDIGIEMVTDSTKALIAPHIRGNTIRGNRLGIGAALNGSGTHGPAWIDGNAIYDNTAAAISIDGTTSVSRLAITGNRIWNNTGAAVSIETPTSAARITGNEAWGNGAGIVFDTALTHTSPVIDSTWVDGADTLPS